MEIKKIVEKIVDDIKPKFEGEVRIDFAKNTQWGSVYTVYEKREKLFSSKKIMLFAVKTDKKGENGEIPILVINDTKEKILDAINSGFDTNKIDITYEERE